MRIAGYLTIPLILIVILFSISCQSSERDIPIETPTVAPQPTLQHVNYFIENSGGMFGYVNGFNNYVSVVSELAQKIDFIVNNVTQQFYFINGFGSIFKKDLGTVASVFTSKLNRNDFNVGNIQGNDLNKMFQLALENTSEDSFSIFITDAIYDIQDKSNPFNALRVESLETRRQFINRLSQQSDIQTLIVKVNSEFNGQYYFGRVNGGTNINMNRPFYVFIFGQSDLMSQFFSDEYITQLDGYENHVRHFVSDNVREVEYVASAYNQRGSFNFGRGGMTTLRRVRPDYDGYLQFSIAADIGGIPFPMNYLLDASNYELSPGSHIVSIEPNIGIIQPGTLSFLPSHVFTIRTSNFIDALSLKLLHKRPDWVSDSHTDDDRDILNQPTLTWGLSYLINGIEGAYMETTKQDYIIKMNIKFE